VADGTARNARHGARPAGPGRGDARTVRTFRSRSGERPALGDRLTDVGFADVREPMVCGATTDEAYALLSDDGPVRGLLADLSDADKATALDKLRAVIAAHETPTGVIFGSASWLIQARRPAAE
jgi:hypothetical protein